MRYSSSAFELAESELRARQTRAEQEHIDRLREIADKAPEIYRMNEEAVRLNYSLISSIGQGAGKEGTAQRIKEIKEKNLMLRQTMRSMLETCGYPADYLQYHYFCEKCRDTGYREGVRCECMKELLKKYTSDELNSHCSIELHDFGEFMLDLYSDIPQEASESPRERMSKLYGYCRNYAKYFDDHGPSLFFFGKTGLGKTFLSSCIAKEVLAQGKNVVYGSLLKLLRQIEDERFHRAEGDTTGILLEADLLILDDLGSEFQTQFTDAVLYEIVNERINSRRPTMISTNLSTRELDKKYNDRIVSRLAGCFVPCAFIGSDVRLEKLKRGIK